ncbi:hypothetical protein IG195_20545 (plasmid) [Arthrobacter sp. TES]|uniref:hypothetical protein n=1 Tax=Paenarthrobacter ureafaciens TaxID=37931 RepID=UPI0011195FD2|nr:hypothetical protein [Paenarthrobacter ureafaciens]QOI65758.1 hypothetical protein IG195_20545 [Arthrobacter sp. TES]GLU61124.1 hypothetical protein Pure01_36370 [Paenarthrobacter ureafaciens]GLU65393.1 hypothetical protein Pure02_36430 [Paenarthrobacter ureafaciens]GLU69780.1 hypothetical protein Pure03_37560 [Paenarthrobacter ureafaciens]GLU73903.1 hypothetical protein Pure04_36180 [Paenarthrobacter ureafaciens]
MSAAVGTCLLVFLRRAGILTGMLALIAGIFGMHVLSGAHDLHTTTASPVSVTQLDWYGYGVAERTPGQLPALAAEPTASSSEALSACLDPATCPTMSTKAQKCIPAPANTSFEAPGPGAALPGSRIDTVAGPRWCPAPSTSSPSPGTLGISRT